MLRITKRDGSHQTLELAKIQRALLMAFNACGKMVNVSPLVQRVAERVSDGASVEQVSQACEAVLVESGHVNVAAGFMRYRIEREAARAVRLVPDNSALADYIHVGKYARYLELGRREVYLETVDRCEKMHQDRLVDWRESKRISGSVYQELSIDLHEAFNLVRAKKVMPSMRSMQFGGKAIEKNNARMYNCSFTHVDRWTVFSEIFFLLLSGCGVGFSVQWQHVECLTEVGRVNGKKVFHYEIPDSIEGWANAIEVLVNSYASGQYAEFSYSKIRDEGSLLKTSGGRAPGHIPLKRCLERVRAILDRAQGRKLRPIEAHDMICHIADAVLAGGIRRSSLISLFSPTDTEMLYAKAIGNFEPGGLNDQRQMANNSAALLRGSTNKEVFDRIIRVARENYGDPGFYWCDNLDYGSNPCGEIGLWPKIRFASGFQFCNLCEVNVAACDSATTFLEACKAAALIGTMQASYTTFDYLGGITEAITEREALIGVGLMGMADNPELAFDPATLRVGAATVVAENQRVAGLIGIAAAARCTTVKPGGTAPLVVGVSSGISDRWARRQIRRVTANVGEAPFIYFRSINPHMCEEKPNGDWVINFPIAAPSGAVCVKDNTAIAFINRVFLVYDNWILPGTARAESAPGLTHNVSSTTVLRTGEEASQIVWDNRERIAAMSFAPYLLDKKFRFAPNEAIVDQRDEAFYNHLIRLYKPVDWKSFFEDEDNTALRNSVACGANGCEVS